MEGYRIAKILENGVWKEIKFLDIKRGMEFKLFDDEDTPVLDKDGYDILIAASDAYLREDGIPTVQIETFKIW